MGLAHRCYQLLPLPAGCRRRRPLFGLMVKWLTPSSHLLPAHGNLRFSGLFLLKASKYLQGCLPFLDTLHAPSYAERGLLMS